MHQLDMIFFNLSRVVYDDDIWCCLALFYAIYWTIKCIWWAYAAHIHICFNSSSSSSITINFSCMKSYGDGEKRGVFVRKGMGTQIEIIQCSTQERSIPYKYFIFFYIFAKRKKHIWIAKNACKEKVRERTQEKKIHKNPIKLFFSLYST